MLCARCRRQARVLGELIGKNDLKSLPGWDRLRNVLCASCGQVLPETDMTDRLLNKLARLGRAGIGAGTAPLLDS